MPASREKNEVSCDRITPSRRAKIPAAGRADSRREPETPAGGEPSANAEGSSSPLAGSKAGEFLAAHNARRMTEAELEENIRDACTKFGIIRFHVRFSLGTTPGLPDDILIGPSGILWRECKNQKNKPTPEQAKTGEALTAIGQDFAIWRPEDWFSGRIQRELLTISRMPVRVSRQSPVTFAPPETLDGAT